MTNDTEVRSLGILPPISKAPMALLTEFCIYIYSFSPVYPRYDLLQKEGEKHNPIFVYSVTVGELVTNGTGPSKKKAKHAAAKAALDALIQSAAAEVIVTSAHKTVRC